MDIMRQWDIPSKIKTSCYSCVGKETDQGKIICDLETNSYYLFEFAMHQTWYISSSLSKVQTMK